MGVLMKLPPWVRRLTRRRRRRRHPPELALVDHTAVRKADPYAFQSAHRRLAWMFRTVAVLSVAEAAVIIVLASAISELVPLKEVQMGLVRVEQHGDRTVPVDPASLVRVLPVRKDTPGFDILMESFVRRYVRMLMEIDKVSQNDRMREANMHSDPTWWKTFTDDKLKEITAALDSGLNRSIVVESADRISFRDNVGRYAVDIVQIDERAGKVIDTQKFRVYVAATSRPHTVRESEKYENPLGLRVLDVSKKSRGNS